MESKETQNRICHLLTQKLTAAGIEVKKEWDAAKDSGDEFTRELYAPRIDVAAGPFMTTYSTRNAVDLEQSYRRIEPLMDQIKQRGEKIGNDFEFNRNPRCLLAIEVEGSGSRKHMVGDVINASILGKIGLVVPVDEENYNKFRKIFRYF